MHMPTMHLTDKFLQQQMPGDLWPSNSRDLNLVNYSTLGCVQE